METTMIETIKVQEHKGVKELILDGLGQINVFAGKNNSGKTSILEALSTTGRFVLGRRLSQADQEWLCKLFAPAADGFTQPNPAESKRWFRAYTEKLIAANTVWFFDEFDKIRVHFDNDLKNDNYLRGYNAFSPKPIFDRVFEVVSGRYKPVLIPAKRHLESGVEIDLRQPVDPDGRGLVNRLFYLKNQHHTSHEYVTYQNIANAFRDVTRNYFNVVPDQENKISVLYQEDDSTGWISSDASGLGLSDVLVILCFVFDGEYTNVLVEEPESHLHPEMQKRMLKVIRTAKSRQFVFSTHSNVFLNTGLVDRVYFCKFDECVNVSDETSRSEVLFNLGYSVTENILADLIVLTEGPTDIPVFMKIMEWLGVEDKFNIKYWPLGGDVMSKLDLSVFAERRNVVAIVDSDPGSHEIRTRFQRLCKEHGVVCHVLTRYSIENYFSVKALRAVVGDGQVGAVTALLPDQKVDSQLCLGEGKSIKQKNHRIIDEMSIQDIEGTDLIDICRKCAQMCGQTTAAQP